MNQDLMKLDHYEYNIHNYLNKHNYERDSNIKFNESKE